MTYEISESRGTIHVSINATSKEELWREAIGAALEAAYVGAAGAGEYVGQVLPIQAVGVTDGAILTELLRACFEAVRTAEGRLLPPKWMSFDEQRVTANLPIVTPPAPARVLALKERASVTTGASGFTASAELEEAVH